MLMLCNREASGSILGTERPATLSEVFRGFSQFLQANAGIVP
jgi:hypothetical protein